jgi:hypothetical protein
MKTPAHDPWSDRLSEYLDGELAGDERARLEQHLATCAACRATLVELEAVVRAARGLAPRAPSTDLWTSLEPSLERSLEAEVVPRRVAVRLWLAFAAGVVVTLAGTLALRPRAGGDQVASLGERYLLLLHEPEGFGADLDEAEHAALVERYGRWALELGERCLGGEELDPERSELVPGAGEPLARPDGARVGGYFLLATRDRAEAYALARTCPHLEQGGSVEIRRIRSPE